MAKKTFKIGEYAKGGIIAVETSKTNVTIINKQWDYGKKSQANAEVISRKKFQTTQDDLGNLRWHLEDLTTPYYAGNIIDWIKQSVTFERSRW